MDKLKYHDKLNIIVIKDKLKYYDKLENLIRFFRRADLTLNFAKYNVYTQIP